MQTMTLHPVPAELGARLFTGLWIRSSTSVQTALLGFSGWHLLSPLDCSRSGFICCVLWREVDFSAQPIRHAVLPGSACAGAARCALRAPRCGFFGWVLFFLLGCGLVVFVVWVHDSSQRLESVYIKDYINSCLNSKFFAWWSWNARNSCSSCQSLPYLSCLSSLLPF